MHFGDLIFYFRLNTQNLIKKSSYITKFWLPLLILVDVFTKLTPELMYFKHLLL